VKISIFTPTRDRLDWLMRALLSVAAQSHEDWEWIVLDNSDEPYFPDGVLSEDPRIRYHWEPCDGVADACTKALALCTGSVCTFLGDDDRLAPQALERVAEAFTQWPDLRWLYAATELRNPAESVICHRGHIPFSLPELRKWYYLGGAVYWRKSLTERLGGYQKSYDGAADYDLYLKFAEDSVPLWIPEVLYLYTDWAGTDSRVRAANQLAKTQEIAARG